jgi:toxin ParE1/3/4
MSRQIKVSHLAQADLDLIWVFVARERNIEAANRVIDSITDRFPLLRSQTRAGRRGEEFGPGTRIFPVGNYLIYYRERKGGIEISRVIHTSRDQRKVWGLRD